MQRPLTLFVVCDATGNTAQQMVPAALAQFQDAPVRLVRGAHAQTPQQVHAVAREIIEILQEEQRGSR